jgi:hypothetical protein
MRVGRNVGKCSVAPRLGICIHSIRLLRINCQDQVHYSFQMLLKLPVDDILVFPLTARFTIGAV